MTVRTVRRREKSPSRGLLFCCKSVLACSPCTFCAEAMNFVWHVALFCFFVLFSSIISEHGPRQAPGYTPKADTQLLRTVLQDSINLLEQVRCMSCIIVFNE